MLIYIFNDFFFLSEGFDWCGKNGRFFLRKEKKKNKAVISEKVGILLNLVDIGRCKIDALNKS